MLGEEVELRGVTKRFGSVDALTDVTFTVRPGRVTGLLGPNGAGKTTALRIALGLVAASEGTATIGGHRYRELDQPLRTVGAVLEASSFHPSRSGRDHLRIQAVAEGLGEQDVERAMAATGVCDFADRRVNGYSLGMRQRLALATALLGDPGVLVLDEPTNGLDPEGIRWIRELLRTLAAQGRTVVVSSHVLSEVAQVVDEVVILARGRLVRSCTLAELERERPRRVRVDGPDRSAVAHAMHSAGFTGYVEADGALCLEGEASAVGRAAHIAGLELSLLAPVADDLETLFLELTGQQR